MNKTEATVVENQTKDKPEKPIKRNREEKLRKKDDKSVDHVLKALSSLETTEEKLGAMCQKYADMFNDHRILQNAAKVAEKKNNILQKEKEQLQAEHSKAILTRSRLESLCRELQRQNKAVKEECMVKIREEEEKKRAVAAKLQSTLTELGTLLAQNNDKNAKLRDDNLDMTAKLKNVCEQYEKKEQHVEKMAKQMHLEMQLANTKLAKAKMEMALEKEALLRDNQQLLLELKEYKTQLEEMKTSEITLRTQIQLYNDKYDEFHKALLQSNDAIGSFKQEMERMSKQIRKLEKETVAWKHRYETTHRTLLQMTEEKIKSDETASVSERRLTALQGLCRSLQAQCNHLREVVKSQSAASDDAVSGESSQGSAAVVQLNSELSGIEVLVQNSSSAAEDNNADVREIANEMVINGEVDSQSIHPEGEVDPQSVHPEGEVDSQSVHPEGEVDSQSIHPEGEVDSQSVHPEGEVDSQSMHPDGEVDSPSIHPEADNTLDGKNGFTASVENVVEDEVASPDKPEVNPIDQSSEKDEISELSDSFNVDKVINGCVLSNSAPDNLSNDELYLGQSQDKTNERNSDVNTMGGSPSENLTNGESRVVKEATENGDEQSSSSAGVPICADNIIQKPVGEVAGPPPNNNQTQSKKNKNKRKKNGGAAVKS